MSASSSKTQIALPRVRVGLKQAMGLLLPYVQKRLLEQIKSVGFIIIYLFLFQTVVLGVPVHQGFLVAFGLALVIAGLTLFMEGLVLGLMPLGDILGVRLPGKASVLTIIVFSFFLGMGATFAEPAIGVLRSAGASVLPWQAPLLYLILNRYADYLVYSVGTGVGIAVILGMLRFLYGWSLKPFLYAGIGTLGGISIYALFDENLLHLTGLAWDSGAVTTGPVTVPLVLALGIGISRTVGSKMEGTAGFGVVTLASLFPILAVLILGLTLRTQVPEPSSMEHFFSADQKEESILLFESPEHYNDLKDQYFQPSTTVQSEKAPADPASYILQKLQAITTDSFIAATRAILPLTIFMLLFLVIFLRAKLPRGDEIALGIVFSLIGMGFFNTGIELGLTSLGNQVGSKLPAAFTSVDLPEQKKIIPNFDTTILKKGIDEQGQIHDFFYVKNGSSYETAPFLPERFFEESGSFLYIPTLGPLFGDDGGFSGIFIVLLFAFIMGYGATMAEPALNALGMKVEEITIGTFKKNTLMQAVALGVGVGIMLGMVRLIWDIPLVYLLLPPYLILIPVTFFSTEEFVNIGWDSAGVTTGPITVPLVLAMGLGVGGQVNMIEGFGILSMASVSPILSVLMVGLYVNAKRNRYIKREVEGESTEVLS